MRRFFIHTMFLASCAFGLWGCGPAANLMARKPWARQGREVSQTNPPRQRAELRSSQTAGADQDAEDAFSRPSSPSQTADASEEDQLAEVDEELLQMIQEELELMPPEEREQFRKDIMSLNPAMVRQIIHTRRIVRQAGHEAPNQFADNERSPGHSSSPADGQRMRLVADEQTSEGSGSRNARGFDDPQEILGRNPARDPGLGGADPWDRETQSYTPEASDEGFSDSAPLPFNRIPAASSAGHTSGYKPGSSSAANDRVPGDSRQGTTDYADVHSIQPPPGGALSPVNDSPAQGTARIQMPQSYRNARIPNDYNPRTPPVPNYGQNGPDPFASRHSRPLQSASRDPDQSLPGSLNMADSFGSRADGFPSTSSDSGDRSAWQADLEKVIRSAEEDVAPLRYQKDSPADEKLAYIQKHVYLRMLYLMAGREEEAIATIPHIPAADQEFWQQTIWAMSNYFATNMPYEDYRATQTISQLRTAIQKLQENARLELRNVAFCHKIASFGNFERFPRDEFGPGQPVLVYAEVANFKSVPTTLPNKPDEPAYRTQLKSSIEIYRVGPNGELVERFNFEPTEDYCHNYRKDYFHSYEFTIPQRISLGPHVMTLTVEDQLSKKVATYSLNFMVQ